MFDRLRRIPVYPQPEVPSMKRLLIVTAALAAALWAAPSASAKGVVEELEVCGQDGQCAGVAIRGLKGPRGVDVLLAGAPRGHAPDHVPFYRLNATMNGGSEVLTLFYVPGGVATDGHVDGWWQLPASLAAAIERAAAPIEPLRDGGVVEVTVDGTPVKDPSAYAALFGDLPYAALSDSQVNERTLVRLSVENDSESPWTGSKYHFALYDPGHHAVQVSGSDWLVAPAGLRDAIDRDAGLATPARTDRGRDIPVAAYLAALAAAVALASLATRFVRRRRYAHALVTKEES
jgi:hypothetical protein